MASPASASCTFPAMSASPGVSGASKLSVDPYLFHSVLVHNVTHSDLLLGLEPAPSPSSTPSTASAFSTLSPPSTALPALPPSSIIAQPKFHRYQHITHRVLRAFTSQAHPQPVCFPSFHYNQSASPASSAPCTPTTPTVPASSVPFSTLPYGFSFRDPLPTFDSWDGFRLRSTSAQSALPEHPRVLAFFFPMLSVLIPKWLQVTELKRIKRERVRELTSSSASSASPCPSFSSSPSSNQLYLYLVSGGGQPWDRSLNRSANSTQYTAQLCRQFLAYFYPSIRVALIHSSTDIFHYDGNVAFVNTQLLPRLQAHSRELAGLFYEHWSQHLHTVLTVTDGPPARVNAISASLRSFVPDCLHMWQLKSFWHEYPAVSGQGEDDVEYQNFEKLEMTPPVRVVDCGDDGVRQLVERLVQFKAMFEARRDGGEYHEMAAFWMRKSRKPVLSVVMVESKRGGRRFYRGINMEVSMPTGSLSAASAAP